MVINALGEYESENDRDDVDDGDSMPELEDPDEGYGAVIGGSLVARRMLSAQFKDDEASQRKNLFHTRCFFKGKVCGVIIYGGSCTNVASSKLVEKLGLLIRDIPNHIDYNG